MQISRFESGEVQISLSFRRTGLENLGNSIDVATNEKDVPRYSINAKNRSETGAISANI